jgi:hypothetical protein
MVSNDHHRHPIRATSNPGVAKLIRATPRSLQTHCEREARLGDPVGQCSRQHTSRRRRPKSRRSRSRHQAPQAPRSRRAWGRLARRGNGDCRLPAGGVGAAPPACTNAKRMEACGKPAAETRARTRCSSTSRWRALAEQGEASSRGCRWTAERDSAAIAVPSACTYPAGGVYIPSKT